MSSAPKSNALLATRGLVIETNRDSFFDVLAINDSRGATIGSARETGSAILRSLMVFSDGFLFPFRPIEVRDGDGNAVLRIERGGLVRRHVATVRRPDSSLLGRLVGKTWASGFRHTGYWVEIDGERVGELLFEKPAYRMVDTTGVELAQVTRRGESRTHVTYVRTTLQTHQPLSEPLAALALAATITRHEGG